MVAYLPNGVKALPPPTKLPVPATMFGGLPMISTSGYQGQKKKKKKSATGTA